MTYARDSTFKCTPNARSAELGAPETWPNTALRATPLIHNAPLIHMDPIHIDFHIDFQV